MKIKLLLLIFCVLIFTQGCSLKKANVEGQKMEKQSYSIADFTKIKIGMTYDEVVELMEKPTGSLGFGLIWYTYELSDDSYVKLFFGSYEELVSMCIVDPDGRVFELKQEN